MEAMARGLPVVSTRLTGIPELVVDDGNGLLVAPEDADGLAGALARILVDRGLRVRLGEEARRTVVANYELDANTVLLGEMLQRSC